MSALATNDALRLSHCTECDYSLEGLPAYGRCPERGAVYDMAMLELRGWGTGGTVTTTNAREFELSHPYVDLLSQRISSWISKARDVERQTARPL